MGGCGYGGWVNCVDEVRRCGFIGLVKYVGKVDGRSMWVKDKGAR